MSWDKSKHKVLASKKVKTDNGKILIEAYSYDKGEPRIGLKQIIVKADKSEIFTPLKGMTYEVAAKVFRVGKKLMAELEG